MDLSQLVLSALAESCFGKETVPLKAQNLLVSKCTKNVYIGKNIYYQQY